MDDVDLGIKAYKEGRRDEARNIFISILKQNPDNERAWAWMSNVVDNDKERTYCLKQVLRINPNNKKADQLLNQILNLPSTPSNLSTPSLSDNQGSHSQKQINSPPPFNNPTINKETQKANKTVTKKASKSLWVIGAALFVGIMGLICIFTVGILFTNWQTAKQSLPNPTSSPNKTIPTDSPATGKWRASTEESEFDNSTTVVLALDAEDYIQGWLDTTRPKLILRCKEGKIDVYVNVGTQSNVEYGLYDAATVRVRFDQNQAVELIANESTDGEALFFQDPYGMIIAMLQSRQMIFGFTPFNADPVTTTFDLRGLSNVIPPLKMSCNWNGTRPTFPAPPTFPPTETATSTATPLPSGSALNLSGTSGKWKAEIEKVELTKSVSSLGNTAKANGQFALIFLRVTNLGKYPDIFTGTGWIQVRSAEGSTYDTDSIATIHAAEMYNVPFGDMIQPDESAARLIVFDLPLTSNFYSLVPGIFAEDSGESIVLDIPK
jgi:hypothetical protein